MKRALFSSVLVLSLSSFVTVGCGALMPQGGASDPSASSDRPIKNVIPQESKDMLRKQEQTAYAQADQAMDDMLDRQEKATLKAVKVALGKEGWAQGMPPSDSGSNILRSLKGSGLKLRLETVKDGDGNAVNDDFLQLTDSMADKLPVISRKMAEHKASPVEVREVQSYAKHAMKLNDLKMQVHNVSTAAMSANSFVQTMSLQTMLRVSGLVRSRKMYEMEMDAGDYKLVKDSIARQRRAEAIAATSMAMLATYQAVLNNRDGKGGDAKALDVIADGALKAFPIQVEVSDDEAKQYVSALSENVGKVKERYEAMMRKSLGDKRYEQTMKAGIDAMFAQAAGASTQKSASDIANDSWAKYKADVVKCKHGEDPGPASQVGASCKAVYRAAQTGDTSDLLPGTKKAFDETGGADPGDVASDAAGAAAKNARAKLLGKNAGKVDGALDVAGAAANGDVDGMIDGAAKVFPADGTIGASLRGISALRKGDAKGAIEAALTFVPVPGLKDAFGLASKLLFKG